MAGNTGPNIVNNGLILNLDAANIKSFKGLSGTNLWYSLNNVFSTTNTSTFKVSYGTEKAFIPYFNGFINTRYCDIYNDYVGGSGQCCPSPFSYHNPNVSVNGNTQYTYQLIFKTTNGYYSTNYMYRYEFGASGLLIEQGLVNASRLESLGNGWYHAWGQFTTNASTTNMTGWLFHYEYLNMNRISVAAVSLTQGSTIHRPEHLINLGFRETRGTTVATGGGWKDLSGNSFDGELMNGVSYDSNNRGSIVFDGVDDYINCGSSIQISNNFTLSVWHKNANGGYIIDQGNIGEDPTGSLEWNGNGLSIGSNNISSVSANGTINTSNWNHIVCTFTSSTVKFYINGVLDSTKTASFSSFTPSGILKIGRRAFNTSSIFSGNIGVVSIYNKVLTDSEVLQNYNSQKSRYIL